MAVNFDRLRSYFRSLPETENVPACELVVTKDHETVFHETAGCRDSAGKVPASEDDWYWMYSCTKVMTVTAVMQLIEQGKIRLYDPVSRFLPEYECMRVYDNDYRHLMGVGAGLPPEDAPVHYAKNPIRIIDLMAMMGGLSYQMHTKAIEALVAESGGEASTREVIRALAESPLFYEPGEDFAYSMCHDVLAAVVEEVSGERFSTYMQEHVFAPAGAADLTFLPGEKEKERISALYADAPDGTRNTVTADGLAITKNYESGGGGLCGTIGSYSRVLEALACGGTVRGGGRILEEESVRRFCTGVTTGIAQKHFELMEKGPYSYGLGVRVKRLAYIGKSPVGEFGWDGAAGAYALVDLKNHVSIAYAEHILGHQGIYTRIHPMLRDLAYEGLGL